MFGLTLFTYYKRRATLLALSGIIMGISLIIFATSPWLSLSLLIIAIFGAMQVAFQSVNTTIIQNAVADNIRGRIMSWREIAFGLGPTGSILFGAIAQYTSVSISVMILGGVSLIVSFVLIGFLRRFRKIE